MSTSPTRTSWSHISTSSWWVARYGVSCRNSLLVAEDPGRLYPEGWARLAAGLVFVGFNLTFLPQFILGYLGMPRRYHAYSPEFQVLNVSIDGGRHILGLGYLLPLIYLLWSLRYGAIAGPQSLGSRWTGVDDCFSATHLQL